MPIALKIISYHRLTPGQQVLFRTDLQRFSIGRSRDNHWTLPDPQRFMSGTHCWIEQRAGSWYVTDTSTNGVYINGSDQRVEKNDSVAVGSGDRIRLGDYELEVEIDGAEVVSPAPQSDSGDPFHSPEGDVFAASVDAASGAGKPGRQEAGHESADDAGGLLGDAVSIDDLYHLTEPENEAAEAPSLARGGDQASVLEQHFASPDVSQEASRGVPGDYAVAINEIPDDWDEETGAVPAPGTSAEAQPHASAEAVAAVVPPVDPSPPSPKETATPPPPAEPTPQRDVPRPTAAPPAEPAQPAPGKAERVPAPSADAAGVLASFAAGAGLDVQQLSVEDEQAFFNEVGELLKTMTAGVMQAIASRGQIKSEFRLEQTMIAPTQNNPFKFSASPQEALLRLLGRSSSAYLSGPIAAAEAIDDVNAHQMAVLAGTEAALKSLLRRFDPQALESKFGEGSALEKALPLVKKAKYWDFYKVLYEEVSEATDDDFQKFFGSEFSDAYEKQLDRLKISRK